MVSFRLADDIKIMWVRGSPGASVTKTLNSQYGEGGAGFNPWSGN